MKNTHRFGTTLFTLAAMATLAVQTPQVQAQTQQATLLAADGAIGDSLGQGVDISGDYAIVGASNEGLPTNSGAAYIYERSAGVWSQQPKIKPAGLQSGNRFGLSVAIDGDTAVVGAPLHTTTLEIDGDDVTVNNSGAVWVYTRTISGWTQQAVLIASDRQSAARFGDSVAIDGDRVVVGAPNHDGAGHAYVFERSGSSWMETAILADSSPLDDYGFAVATSADTVFVGAKGVDVGIADDAGAAHVYNYSAGSWLQQPTLQASTPESDAAFGWSVALDGDTAAIGAALANDGATADVGAVYVFQRTAGVWAQVAAHSGTSAHENDMLGTSVAISGDIVVAGAPTFGSNSGVVYMFRRDGGAWNEDPYGYITANFTQDQDLFGTSVAVDDAYFVVGAIANEFETDIDAGTADNFGSAYIFEVEAAPVTDSDGDGIEDMLDNCPSVFNDDQANFDLDSQGNACDLDDDNDGLSDAAEAIAGSNPLDTDSDDDTLSDNLEVTAIGTNPILADTDEDGLDDALEHNDAGCLNPLDDDSDNDGLLDGLEANAGADPCDADTDGDGLSDGEEENEYGTDPNDTDSDDDSLTDDTEVAMAAGGSCPDPNDSDSDDDGTFDADEVVGTCGPCDGDADDDGLCAAGEALAGTNPNNADSDADGLLDGAEVATGCTNPLVGDSDLDTLTDGAEVTAGTNPCNADTDGDLLPDNVDPHPLTPAITPAILANMTLALAGSVLDTPTSDFLGPNQSVKKARRAVLASQIALAACAIHHGNYCAAEALLTLALSRVDGHGPQPDWMADGCAKSQVRTDLQCILTLLDLID